MRRIALSLMLFTITVLFTGCANHSVIERTVKQEIVVACGKDETNTISEVMQSFTSQSETTRVKLLEFSNKSIELHRVISSMLAGQEIQIDAMLIEDVWVREFMKNNYLLPLFKKERFDTDFYPLGIGDFVGDSQDIYWFPIILDTGIIYYLQDSTDSSEKFPYIIDVSKETYDLQEEDGEEILCCALEFINLKGSIKEGLKQFKKVFEDSVVKDDNYLVLVKDSTTKYMRSWASNSRSISNIISNFSDVSGRVCADVMLNSNKKGYAITRAYGYSVNRYTDSAENCMELLEYLKSDEVQMRILKGTGTLPLKRQYYQNPIILDYTDYTDEAAQLFDSLIFRPARDDYTYVSRETRVALNDYLNNDDLLDAAVAAFERLLDIRQ